MASNFAPRVINWDDWREVALFTFAAICLLAIVVVVSRLTYEIATWESEQIVSGPAAVSSQWSEFTPAKPLRCTKQYQDIVLEVDPAAGLIIDNLHPDRIQLANGVPLHPEIQLVDSQGNVFVTQVSGSEVESGYVIGGYAPHDGVYTKIRVRVDAPLNLSRIVWNCSRAK
jgi:hypothetical protein